MFDNTHKAVTYTEVKLTYALVREMKKIVFFLNMKLFTFCQFYKLMQELLKES